MIWHRRTGKDKTCLNFVVPQTQTRVGSYYYFLPTYTQGKKVIWDGMDRDGFRFMNHFPKEIVASKNETEMKVKLLNGSIFQVIGTDNIDAIMGTNPVGCVFSEFSLQDPTAWDYVRPILSENDGWAVFPYTPRGLNHGYDLYMMARANPSWFCEVLTVNETGYPMEKVEEERRAGMSEDMIAQEFYCLVPGTKIWTTKGQVSIENVNTNDFVLTHAGRWRKVTQLHSRYVCEELIEINSSGCCESLVCTKNHNIKLCDPHTQTYRWVEASNIKQGDYVVLPRLKNKSVGLIDSDLAELIAWFITEGSVAKNAVQFSLNKKEKEFASRIKILGERFGNVLIFESTTTLVVVVKSCWLADFLVSNCGSGAANKHIPWQLISGSEELVYKTLIDGDGCRGSYGHGVSDVLTTISYGLALDVQMLAHMIGKRCSINKRPKEKQTSVIEGRKVNISDSYSVRVSQIKKTINGKPKILPQKHAVACEVISVSRIGYSGKVHNLGVQFDESYVANGRVVHNCSFTAAIPGAYYSNEIRKMHEQNRICQVPYQDYAMVDTWWDLGVDDSTTILFTQDIGREIHIIDCYEGRSQGLQHYASVLRDKMQEGKWIYGTHNAPHDVTVRELGTGESRLFTARKLGVNFRVAPRVGRKEEGIQSCRNIFPSLWIDQEKCKVLIQALTNYHSEYDTKRKVLGTRPVHDWSSHWADALQTLALGHTFQLESFETANVYPEYAGDY